MKLFHLIPSLVLPLTLFAGDPIPGIDITVNQSPGGIAVTGTTGQDGTVILSGLRPGGRCTITLSHKGHVAVIGAKPKENILIPANSKAPIKPIRMEVAMASTKAALGKKGYGHYQSKSDAGPRGGDDSVVRKKPGAKAKKESAGNSGNQGTKAQDYNSSRSNKPTTGRDDDDSDGDGIADAVEAGPGQVVEITPLGRGQIKILVTSAS